MSLRILSVIAAVVIISLGGYLFHQYGKARFDAGVQYERAKNAEGLVKKLREGNVIIQRTRRETEIMSDHDIDRGLRSLNIMRSDEDL